jgi:hypothetical protein
LEASQVEAWIGDLEIRLERLRALYDQYFMGIEKLEPTVARTEVDKRIDAIRREPIRNTALKFRFQTLVARYQTYQQLWGRICRQIEEGTYRRDVVRAKTRLGIDPTRPGAPTARDGDDRHGAAAPGDEGWDIEADFDDEAPFDGELDQVFRHVTPSAPAPVLRGAPPPTTRSPESLPARAGAPPKDTVPGLPPSDARPERAAARATGRNAHDSSEAPDTLRSIRAATPAAFPPLPLVVGANAASPPPGAPPRPPMPSRPEGHAPPRPPMPSRPEGHAPPRPPMPSRPEGHAPPRPPMPSRPEGHAPPRPPMPSRPEASGSPRDEVTDERVRALHAAYMAARARRNDPSPPITVDGLAKTLRDSTAKLREKHGRNRRIDFEVIEKDGKAVIRPIVK